MLTHLSWSCVRLYFCLAFCVVGSFSQTLEKRRFNSLEVDGGFIYVQPALGQYLAVNATAKQIAWRYHSQVSNLFTRPVVTATAVIVMATSEEKSTVVAVDNGRPAWSFIDEPLVKNSAPLVCGEYLIFGQYWKGQARAVNITDGKVRWETKAADGFLVHPPAIRSGVAYYVSGSGGAADNSQIVSLDCADGRVISRTPISWRSRSNRPIVLYDDNAIVFWTHPHDGTHIMSVDLKSGLATWRLDLEDLIEGPNDARVNGDELILSGRHLWFVDLKTGRILSRRTNDVIGASFAVSGSRTIIEIGRNKIAAIAAGTHAIEWRAAIPSAIGSNLGADRNAAYVRTQAGYLVALDTSTGRMLWKLRL